MKQLIYCVIIAMGISLAFSLGKPCCNKKAGKNAISCKFNQAAIGEDKDAAEGLQNGTSDGNQQSNKCSAGTGNQCSKSVNNPWWKFWAKKSSISCPCKQAGIPEAASAE